MRRLHLIESTHTVRGSGVHSLVSVTAHVALVAAAFYATTRPAVAREDVPDPRVYFVPEAPVINAPAAQETPPAAARKERSNAAPLLSREPAPSPVDPPTGIPAPEVPLSDPSLPVLGAGEGTDEPVADPEVGGGGRTGPYEAAEVEIPAAPLSRTGPEYPERALRLGLSGAVTVRFVVDAAGRVESDIRILDTTGPDFTAAVRSFLRRARYRPAQVGGQPVRQMVEQRFVFELRN